MKDIWKSLVGILIGAIFLYLTLKDTKLSEIADNLKASDPKWILISGVILFFVFLFRALRWNVMLDNIGHKIKDSHILYYTLMGYLINSFTPKFGEVLRCTALAKDADIPVPASLGSVIMERVYDVVVLLIGLIVLSIVEAKRLGELFSQAYTFVVDIIDGNGTMLILLLAGLLLLTVIGAFILHKINLFSKVKTFVTQLMSSVFASIKMKRFPLFILHTIIIWLLLVALNYVYLLAIPQVESQSIYFAVIILFVGAIGWALPSPNGIGTTHFIILQLFLVFAYKEEAAITFGILSNGLILIYTIVFGLIAIGVKLVSKNWAPKIVTE